MCIPLDYLCCTEASVQSIFSHPCSQVLLHVEDGTQYLSKDGVMVSNYDVESDIEPWSNSTSEKHIYRSGLICEPGLL